MKTCDNSMRYTNNSNVGDYRFSVVSSLRTWEMEVCTLGLREQTALETRMEQPLKDKMR